MTSSLRPVSAFGLAVGMALAAGCDEGFPEPEARTPERAVGEIAAADFPTVFDPALWDIDPQIGNAIAGTGFDADGGRRQGILQLFVANTANLDAFLAQEEARIDKTSLEFVGGSAYDLNDDGRALYTHIGLFDKAGKPVKLLDFTQVNGTFADTAADLAKKVQAVLAGEDIAPPPARRRAVLPARPRQREPARELGRELARRGERRRAQRHRRDPALRGRESGDHRA